MLFAWQLLLVVLRCLQAVRTQIWTFACGTGVKCSLTKVHFSSSGIQSCMANMKTASSCLSVGGKMIRFQENPHPLVTRPSCGRHRGFTEKIAAGDLLGQTWRKPPRWEQVQKIASEISGQVNPFPPVATPDKFFIHVYYVKYLNSLLFFICRSLY